jgi:hypothetical protein
MSAEAGSAQVFLSHASVDGDHVALVQGQIEALGLRAYLAEHDPQPGTSLAAKVDRALQQSALVVVLLTHASVNSSYVQQEIGTAVAYRKPIIPIVDARLVGSIDLAMLAGTEYLVLDVNAPAEALHKITARLDSLRLPLPAPVPRYKPASAGFSDTDKLILLAGVLFVALMLASAEGGAGAA